MMGGASSSAVTTWDPADKDPGISLSNGNLRAIRTGGTTFGNAISTSSRTAGKLYFEVTKAGAIGQNSGGVPCVGLINKAAYARNNYISSQTSAFIRVLTYGPIDGGEASASVPDWSAVGSVLCIAVDVPNRRFWARTAGGLWNGISGANPAEPSGHLIIPGSWAMTIACDPYSTNQGFDLNCGQAAFVGAVPAGFTPWG